jgi:hypothetical protein
VFSKGVGETHSQVCDRRWCRMVCPCHLLSWRQGWWPLLLD